MTPTKPGPYTYANPGEPPQRVVVKKIDGDLFAVFEPIEGDDERGDVPVADMAGEFEPAG